VTHTFDIGDTAAAYQLIGDGLEPYLAIQLDYPDTPDAMRPVQLRQAAAAPGEPGIGLVGAGAFAAGTLLPALRAAGFSRLVAVASAGGLTATRLAKRHGFEKAVSGAEAVIADPGVSVIAIATPHDTHASLAVQALAAGRHVWCEKPLALSADELDAVRAAWLESGQVLAIGFNRRWSPAVAAARRALAGNAAAKLVVYRVAAGPVPEDHWYRDPRQGGRVLGEVSHFIDTAQALVGAPIEDVTGLSGGAPGGPADDAVVALRFADGSLASIGYGSAVPSAGKERIEVHAGDRRIVIDDFRLATADGKTIWKGRQDKGHRALAGAFRRAVAGNGELPTEEMLATMRATIQAAATRGSHG
jgi:predicted dehydrogenase